MMRPGRIIARFPSLSEHIHRKWEITHAKGADRIVFRFERDKENSRVRAALTALQAGPQPSCSQPVGFERNNREICGGRHLLDCRYDEDKTAVKPPSMARICP